MNHSKKILIITGDAGESFEVLYALHRFREEDYEPVIAAPTIKRLNLVIHDFEPGWDTYVERPGYIVESHITFDEMQEANFDAIFLIGGRAPEYLRNDKRVISIVRQFNEKGKPVLAICHGIQILVTAGLVDKKNITCYEHVRFEVECCGGTYIEAGEAVIDGNIVTGKTWQSHPEFFKLVFKLLKSGG